MNDKQLAKFSIETMLNNYRGDSAKLEKARKYLSELRNGKTSPIGAYNKVYDILIGEETENGETLPALSAPKNILNSPQENISEVQETPQEEKSNEKSESGKEFSAEEIDKRANEILKKLKLKENSAPASYMHAIYIGNIRDGYVNDEIFVSFGYNDYKKVWNSVDKIAGKTNAKIDSSDNRNHEYIFKNLNDARIFAKATQKLLRGIDGEELKILEDLPTREEYKVRQKVFDEMEKIGKERQSEYEKIGRPLRNIREDTLEIPQKNRGVHYIFPKIKTGEKTWFYYPNNDEFYDDETQDMYKPADEVLQNALEYFYNYGDAEKAVQAIEFDLKYDNWTVKYLADTLKKSKQLLLDEGKNWQIISPQEKEIEEEIFDEEESVSENTPAETKKAAVTVTGDEFGEYADIKELRKKAIQYYKDHLQGTSVENKTLGKIDLDENGLVEFTGEGRRKVISNSAREDTLLLIKHLPQLIENAENISHKEAESEKHRAVGDSFYYLDTEYIKNNENIPLRVTLKKLHTGNIHYYNHVINPQNEKDVSVSSGTESSNAEANVSPTVNTSSTENITQNEESGKEKSDANEFFEEYLRENNLEENKNDLSVPSAQVTENDDGIPTIDKSFAENISQTADDGKKKVDWEDIFDKRIFKTNLIDENSDIARAKKIIENFEDGNLNKTTAVKQLKDFLSELNENNSAAYNKLQNLLDNYEKNSFKRATPEEIKHHEDLKKKSEQDFQDLQKAMDDFYSGKIINEDALNKDLDDPNSEISKFLKENDIDKDGNITPKTKKTAIKVTGDEFGEYGNIEELRGKAIQYYKDHLQGTSVENKTLGKIDIDENGLIEFTTSGRKKLQTTSRENRKLLLIKHLPKLLESAINARNVESQKEKHNRESFVYMDNEAEIDGENVPVHITLVKRNNGDTQFYNFNFIENEKHAGKPARPESSNEALGTLPVGVSSAENIAQTADDSKENSDEIIERRANEILGEINFKGQKYDVGRNPSIIITGNPYGWQNTQKVYLIVAENEEFLATADHIAKTVKAMITKKDREISYKFVNSDSDRNLIEARAFAKALQKIINAETKITDEFNDSAKNEENKNFNDALFEIGDFINPVSLKRREIKKGAGVRLKKKLSPKEYSEIKEIAEEYGGWDYEGENMFLFASKEDRANFIADANKDYLKTPETAPLAAARTWGELRIALDDNYGGILIPLYESFGVRFKEAKKIAIDAVNLGLKNGTIKYSDGKIIVSNKNKKILQEYFDDIFGTEFAKTQSEQGDKVKIQENLFGKGNSLAEKIETEKVSEVEEKPNKDDDKENSDIQQNLFDEESAVTEEKTDIEAEKFAPKNKYGIIFPEGNLKIRGRDAVKYFESFKGMTPSKATKFNESMDKVEKINGKDKTRREIIEGIGKGEIEESAIKLRKDEQEYLKFINEKLIEPLRAIKNAGLEKTRVNLPKLSETKYPYDFRGYSEFDFTKVGKHYIDFPELKDGYNELVQNTEALGAIEKLLKSLGGKLEKREKTSYSNEAKDFIKLNSYRVNFFDNQKGADTFGMSVNMLVQNEHLPYFEKSISDGEKPVGENITPSTKNPKNVVK